MSSHPRDLTTPAGENPENNSLNRRRFLAGAGLTALAGASLAASPVQAAKLLDDLTTGPNPNVKADYPSWLPYWEDIEAQAKKDGQVMVTAWGDPSAKKHFSEVCREFEKKYGIKAPYTHGDWFSAQQKVLNEVQNKRRQGDIDCIFLWGKPFANLLEGGGVWEVPFLDMLPNARKVAYRAELGRLVHDMVPTYGSFVPHVNWQDCFVYNKKKFKREEMPQDVTGVLAWAKKHPRQFSYCDPNKGGSGHTWIMQMIYSLTGGYEKYAFKPFHEEIAEKDWGALWEYLKELKQYMYKPGLYPQGNNALAQLFAAEEITFMPNWNSTVGSFVLDGNIDPAIVSCYVPKPSICSPCDGFTIPFNAPHKAAALLWLNYATSLEVQKTVPINMCAYPVVTEAWDQLPEQARKAPYQPASDLRSFRDLGTIYARHGKYMFHMMTKWVDRIARA